jgi:hypothetical protein
MPTPQHFEVGTRQGEGNRASHPLAWPTVAMTRCLPCNPPPPGVGTQHGAPCPPCACWLQLTEAALWSGPRVRVMLLTRCVQLTAYATLVRTPIGSSSLPLCNVSSRTQAADHSSKEGRCRWCEVRPMLSKLSHFRRLASNSTLQLHLASLVRPRAGACCSSQQARRLHTSSGGRAVHKAACAAPTHPAQGAAAPPVATRAVRTACMAGVTTPRRAKPRRQGCWASHQLPLSLQYR